MVNQHDGGASASGNGDAAPHDSRSAPVARIVVPLDGSPLAEQALDYAFAFARALGIELRLVRVVPPPSPALIADPSAPYLSPELYEELLESGLDEARTYLHEQTTKRFPGARTLSTTVVRGMPGEAIVEIAHELLGTLIVMSSHGRTGIGRAVLGSVAEHVVRNGRCPVVLVRSGMKASPLAIVGAPIVRIVVALDGSASSEAVLPTVEALAGPMRAQVALVYVRAARSAASDAGKAVSQIERVRQQLQATGITADAIVIDGQSPTAITRLEGLDDRSLIAMATHARAGVDRLVGGSVAGDVFREAPCPVLLVRCPEAPTVVR